MYSLKALRHWSHRSTCKLHHACLSFVSVQQMALPVTDVYQTSSCSLLLIYRPRKDERLSWPGCLTCSGRFIHIYRSGAGQGMFAGQRPTFYPCATQREGIKRTPRAKSDIYNCLVVALFCFVAWRPAWHVFVSLCVQRCKRALSLTPSTAVDRRRRPSTTFERR